MAFEPISAPRVRATGAAMAVVAATTPIGLAGVVAFTETPPIPRVAVLAGATVWACSVVGYQTLMRSVHQRQRRRLTEELSKLKATRIEMNIDFRGKLAEQQAILQRIEAVSNGILDGGIIDPRLTLDDVRVVRSHAREALNATEEAIIEARLDVGAHEPSSLNVDGRDEIEKVVAPFSQTGMSISTGGPRHFAMTDPPTLRVAVRSLINSAIARDASDIDVTIARDGHQVVFTVSDTGASCAEIGVAAIPKLTRTLIATIDSEIRFNRALGRNQFSVAVPAGVEPELRLDPADPMDVLGSRSDSEANQQVDAAHEFNPQELIGLESPEHRDKNQSVAAKRKSQLLAR